MDQTAPADQVVLWHESERCEGSNLDRGLGLLARGDRQKAPRHRIVALHNPTDSERVDFRENTTGQVVFGIGLQ